MSSLIPSFHEGKFDVALLAGPRADPWPGVGAHTLSKMCAEMGLAVGILGGETIQVRGVIPLPGSGGLVVAHDQQHRFHRIRARAIVRVSAAPELPDPFPGWRSPGLIPLSTAEKILGPGHALRLEPGVAILGTGNRALRFGSRLLEDGAREIFCVEQYPERWGRKRYAGWEVERRRFEMAGGRILEAEPVNLSSHGPMRWELRVKDQRGVRVLQVAWVVSAGPFSVSPGAREYPAGSLLFELMQTGRPRREDDVLGWNLEEERARYLAGKISRALTTDLGSKRDELDRLFRRARTRLRRSLEYQREPFEPAFEGKWLTPAKGREIRAFSGAPGEARQKRLVASIECFENIACNACEAACPEDAIDVSASARLRGRVLDEAKCTACGICLRVCPSGAPLLIHEPEGRSTAELKLPWRAGGLQGPGHFARLLNRRGDNLGSARITALEPATPEGPGVELVTVEVPAHLAWEARGLRKPAEGEVADQVFLSASQGDFGDKIEITLNGARRIIRDKVPMSVALFEVGYSRPEDVMLCPDGSCGLCEITVDGIKRLACQTLSRRGMVVLSAAPAAVSAFAVPSASASASHSAPAGAGGGPSAQSQVQAPVADADLCPCLGISRQALVERLRQGKLRSPDGVISVTHVGEGKCHGEVCMELFRRALTDEGLDASQWIDWRFPWSQWVLSRN